MDVILSLVLGALLFVLSFWWVAVPVALIPLLLSALTFWRQQLYKAKSMESALLELRIPPDLARTPRAMEQVLVAMHGLRNAPRGWKGYHIDGQVTRWFSLEIVSQGGMLRFFVRTPAALRNIVEASLYSYYPEVEILTVPDYVADLPSTIYELDARDMDLWGTEITAAKEPAIPFKTYAQFSSGEKDGIDPLSSLIEIMGKLKKTEFGGIQIVIQPADRSWNKGGGDILAKIKEGAKDGGVLTPGETANAKEIEDNVSKPAFNTLVRVLYVAPKEGFSSALVSGGVNNAYNQLSGPKYNAFSHTIGVGGKGESLKFSKARMLWAYRRRSIPEAEWFGKVMTNNGQLRNFKEKWVPINVEVLATMFHPLTSSVLTAPHLERLSSRRVSAPAGLSIYGDDDAIKRFL